jgi:hypothetical protein
MYSAEPKVNTPKAKLPTKTRIAVWWMITVGIVLTIGFSGLLLVAILYSFGEEMDGGSAVPNLVIYFFLPFCGIFTFISGIFLFKKRSWKVAVTILVIAIIYSLGTYLYIVIYHCDNLSYMITIAVLIGSLIYLTPLILIILDRKNYFEIVRQRELEKKEFKTEKPENNHRG